MYYRTVMDFVSAAPSESTGAMAFERNHPSSHYALIIALRLAAALQAWLALPSIAPPTLYAPVLHHHNRGAGT